MIVSIFNDVVGPVMRGASSSHCAAALRIGSLARDLVDEQLDQVLVQFDRSGSLPTTHTSQGSDMGLFGGLLGWTADDPRLPDSDKHLRDAGIDLQIQYGDYGDAHPNTYRLSLTNSEESLELIAISTGGGMIEVIQIDGFDVSVGGDFDETLVWFPPSEAIPIAEVIREKLQAEFVHIHRREDVCLVQIQTCEPPSDAQLSDALPISNRIRVRRLSPVLPVLSRRDLHVPFLTCNELLGQLDRDHVSLADWAIEYEMARGNLAQEDVIEKMAVIVRTLRESVAAGLKGTQYDDRVLGFQSGGFQDALRNDHLLDAGVLNQIVLYTTALMEVKSSMGVIVAAPTAGACAALPATCLAMGEALALNDDEIARAMLAAGLIGVFIANAWSFAAEVGGCQAEGGSASAMSAAALVTMAGGTTQAATSAASMALQNMLGLICDPVANRVEVPCLGKNVMAASNAMSCANMALAGFDAVIPLDETIDAARRVSERMPREHRCTALGGLATTPTSLRIMQELEQCAGGSCCATTGSPVKISTN